MTLIKKAGTNKWIPTLRNNLSDVFDLDHLFDKSLIDTLGNGKHFSRIPATNILEKDKEYIVEVAAPGMKKEDFHVNLDNQLLEIKVEKEEESKEENENYTRKEYDYTSFYRSFDIPESIKSEKIKAEYLNGVLKIHLPKVMNGKKKSVKEIIVK